jgi:hypothetical protein
MVEELFNLRVPKRPPETWRGRGRLDASALIGDALVAAKGEAGG